MNAHPHDDDGLPGTVYVLHFDPPYHHTGHYVGWTAGDVDVRVQMHRQGAGSPLIRAAVAAGVSIQLGVTFRAAACVERRLKRWHKTGQFWCTCRAHRGGRAR